MNFLRSSTLIGILLALLISVGLLVAAPVFAQEVDLESFAEQAGFSTTADITVIIARLIRTAISFIGVIAVAFVIYGGFMFMTAGGNVERVKSAKKILINALIGLLLVFASFAIVSFILDALTDATSSDITSESSSGSSSYSDSSSSAQFYLRSVNTDCAEALQNLELKFIFSKKVDETTVESAVVISETDGTVVDGTFEFSGKTMSFTPTKACDAPYEAYACFGAGKDYTIEIDATILESSTGSALVCSTTYPCSFDFTTGTGVDIDGPTVTMDAPEDGESLYQGSIELLEATTTDDTGVSSVDFYLIDDDEALYTSGVDLSTLGALTGGDVENAFYTDISEEWDTSGYTTNETYSIWATGSDCAGNDDTASAVDIVLRAANCNNEVQDEDLGETDVDCGGDDTTSAYYCGACEGDECTESSECASGQCVDGTCVETPKIESVSAGDGAVGNLITISGEAFGDDEGTVTFLATESGDEITASAYSCNSETQWSDTEIIVQVPDGALDGPISVTTTDTTQDPDRTDDDYGPSIADFDVNLIARPGICLLDPDSATSSTAVSVWGNSFGDGQGTSTFYFTTYEASSYVSWEDALLAVGVPNVNAGEYQTQLFTGDYVCINTLGALTGSTCSDDADCDEDADETCATAWCSESLDYCDSDDDCGDDEGECESIRVGSNEVTFTVLETSSETTPVISSIDTGWTACAGGADDGEHCGRDSDCELSACEDESTWGPAGQYVTIYGTNFGTAEGSVFLESSTLGQTALADTEFPEACGEDFWHDTYITIKIPEQYLGEVAIEALTHDLYIERQDGEQSDSTDVVVLDDTPGPSICDLDPSAGPVGTEVTIYGENFGADDGDVEFYSEAVASYSLWENDQVSTVVVPDGAVTGPVSVIEAEDGYSSNSTNFEVGDCNEDADLCDEEDESCCGDGSCGTSCDETEEVSAHYAFKVSTGTTPNTPEVVTQCDSTIASPSPWGGWSDPENICINAKVHADFDMTMDESTLNDSNITVEKCTEFYTAVEEADGDGTEGECKTWETMSGGSIVTSADGFDWTPSDGSFEASVDYRVTLNGSGEEGAIQADASEGGGYLDGDYSWEFTTSDSTDLCEVGGVNMSPLTESVADAGDINYLASLVSADDQCVTLSCTGYYLGWESDFDGATVPSGPFYGDCANVVTAVSETTAGDPAIVTATVDAEGDPSGDGELTINFTDPEVDDYFPDCSTACVNAMPWAEFNTDMDAGTITTSSVVMYVCEDSLCAESEITAVTFVDSVDYDSSTQRLEIVFTTMTANTWYRIVLDGDVILAANGNQLSESGSNYGDDANRYFEDDFSWVFQTKDSDVTCKVDSVVVSPDETTATYVGDRAEFSATAYGEPDDCAVDGQALQAGSYSWEAWSASDKDNLVGAAAGSSTDQDEIVAYMITSGEIELSSDLPAYCSGSCLYIGASVSTSDGVCGNGTVETYEECDDGATTNGDGCSSLCLDEGTIACTATVTSGCCGDSSRDWTAAEGGEDCDDGNSQSGDGCSSVCLNEGARSVGSTCGDAVQDWAEITGGEDCDDDNTVGGDGCSSNCLKEGSLATEDVYAICGNSSVESGEDCDNGNVVDGDGCSSLCLNEGTNICASASSTLCCGNSTVETGEDCEGDDGCSDSCLNEGSSYTYTTPSFCGDGSEGVGEECDASPSSTFAVGAYGVGQIAQGAPQEVNTETGYAVSSISATVDGATDTATYQLLCSCTTDTSCGEVATLGCGESNCCYERPELGEIYPADNTSSSPPGEGYCRNTAVWAQFSVPMDDSTFGVVEDDDGDGSIQQSEFDASLYLDLLSVDGVDVDDSSDCPSGYTGVAVARADSSSFFARAWVWMKSFVLGFFGVSANASDSYGCYIPVTYETSETSDGGERVYLRYGALLEANAEYRLVVLGDDTTTDTTDEGVLSESEVALCLGSDCSSDSSTQEFYVGEEVCALDRVLVEDQGNVSAVEYEDLSEEFFSSIGEEHDFLVTPQTKRSSSATYEEISEITGIYEWSWGWSSSVDDDDEDDVVALVGSSTDSSTASYTASGTSGDESVIVTATIAVDEMFETSTFGDTTTGLLDVTALVCENPWPSLDSTTLDFPYVEDVMPSYFSFYYCRDAGETGTDDDLPALEDPIDVTSLSSSSIRQELIFKVEDTSDAIGVRVIPNEGYLSPTAWVALQEFTGSFSETELDGYAAVESGTTLYASAANQSGTTIYPNMYVVSYNDDAGEEAIDIFAEILENWKFNANDDVVTDVNLCSDGTDYIITAEEEYLSCDWEGDCVETCVDSVCSLTGEACAADANCELVAGVGVCDADKGKLTRDMKRLTDMTDMAATLQTFGEENAHCAVTTDESCETSDDCPGTEECLLGFPDVQTGTFVPALTNSAWGSWNSAFANELGDTPPTDPTNEFYNCDEEGYDSASCWDGEAGTFICPDNSHVYGYQSSGGIAYTLYSQMETSGNVAWAYDLDTDSTDEGTIVAEYPTGKSPSVVEDGFVLTPEFCDGGTWGDSTICGDGTQGVGETCEIGDTKTISCDSDTGVISSACYSDATYGCTGYQTEAEAETAGAECEPYSCGNGVVETGETCDDGSLNGTYGYCDDNCEYDDAFLCGDGYLAGTEACDCGETGLYSYSSSVDACDTDSESWACLSVCDVSNGQYSSDITVSCAYDCTEPGLSCGDEVVNGAEQCDGDYEDWEGALCSDGTTACTTDSDCDSTDTCGSTTATATCGTGDVCTDWEDAGEACEEDSDCDSENCNDDFECASASNIATGAGAVCDDDSDCESVSCPDFNYSLFRYRNCESACTWPSWSECVGGEQVCGNGSVEGAEECDDGNSSNNDDCLNTCVENVCGDDDVETGVESCDNGDENGEVCEAGYEDTCNYCNTQCQYKTRSGGYCGDEEVNGDEVCDGGYSTKFYWYDGGTGEKNGTCDEDEYETTDTDSDGVTYTCRWQGVCNGGAENGESCSLDYDEYVDSGAVEEISTGSDYNTCRGDLTDDTDDGECVPPVCADNCGSSCPLSFETTSLLIQSELFGASKTDKLSLYSYQNAEGNYPDNATVSVPACSVATQITADIDTSELSGRNIDLIFIIDYTGTMKYDVDGNAPATGESSRMDIVSATIVTAIERLFDELSADALRIGLMSIGSDSKTGKGVYAGDGYKWDAELSDDLSENQLVTKAEEYAAETGLRYGPPIYMGLEAAIDRLEWSTNDVRVIVLLSDGETYIGSDSRTCSSSGKSATASTQTCEGGDNLEACDGDMYYCCTREVDYGLLNKCSFDDDVGSTRDSDIKVYTAAITSSSDDVYAAYMAHMSSEECGTDYDNIDDCGTGAYAFTAQDEDGVVSMYDSIIDSVIGMTFTLSATTEDGTVTTTTGSVEEGDDQVLPFPDAFACSGSETDIPLRAEFGSDGAISLSDLSLTYCPYE